MTQKLLLAESLDLLRQSEMAEYDLDRTKERIRGSSKYKGELSRLVQGYYGVYNQFLRGLDMLNYIRHQALDDPNPQTAQYHKNLADFCSGKMTAYMDRCENIIRKIDSILLPLDQVDLVTKEGYVPEETLFIQDGTSYPLTRKESVLTKEFTLMDGTYVLTIKNKDSYAVAAPSVDVLVTVTPQRGSGAEPQRVTQSIPTESGWRKVIGVMAAATLQLEIRCSGLRDAHVDVLLQRWSPAGGPGGCPFAGDAKHDFSSDFASVTKSGPGDIYGGDAAKPLRPGDIYGPDSSNPGAATSGPTAPPAQSWAATLPAIPDDDLAALANYNVPHNQLPPHIVPPAPQQQQQQQQQDSWNALEHLNVPHVGGNARSGSGLTRVPDPVEVNPSGMTCKDRLGKVREMLNAWPGEGVPMVSLPSDKQRIVQSVYALPLPRELS